MGSITETLFGIGQGNGRRPDFWLSHLIVMFWILDELTHGIQFKSPTGRCSHKSLGMGFVDDVTLGCTRKYETEDNNKIFEEDDQGKEVLIQITDMAQKWEDMLYTDGGLLDFTKCFWIYIGWKWAQGVAIMKTTQESPRTLKVQQTQEKKEFIIQRKTISCAPKILGCHIVADGNWKQEKKSGHTT